MKNLEIRQEAAAKGVRLWQVAERYGCNDSNFSRKLRKEFPPPERERVLAIIDKIAQEQEAKS
ncbi:MAG: hypothetical protein LUH45_05845 [Clostridiales bacterium]|nr:hypothetical protein [Clostridiales bacterium]